MTPPDTGRLHFRRFRDADVEVLAEMFADPEVMRFSPRGLFDYDQTVEWLAGHHERFDPTGPWGFRAAIVKETGAYAGHVGLLNQTVEGVEYPEVGYWLHRAHWGKGYATEAARAFRDHAFAARGFDHVISLIVPDNLASQAVARRNGLVEEARARWKDLDVIRFGITRETWERRPR